jgi:hypothetical protein
MDREAKIVDNYLAVALAALREAMKAAEAAGYGDQLRGVLSDAIGDVECTRGMLL